MYIYLIKKMVPDSEFYEEVDAVIVIAPSEKQARHFVIEKCIMSPEDLLCIQKIGKVYPQFTKTTVVMES